MILPGCGGRQSEGRVPALCWGPSLGMHTPSVLLAGGARQLLEEHWAFISHLNPPYLLGRRSYLLTTITSGVRISTYEFEGRIQTIAPPEWLPTIRLLLCLLPFIKYIAEQESKTKMLVASSVFLWQSQAMTFCEMILYFRFLNDWCILILCQHLNTYLKFACSHDIFYNILVSFISTGLDHFKWEWLYIHHFEDKYS